MGTAACEKKHMKPLWLQRKLHIIWQPASSNVTLWLNCIVGNKCIRFRKNKKNVWDRRGDISGSALLI